MQAMLYVSMGTWNIFVIRHKLVKLSTRLQWYVTGVSLGNYFNACGFNTQVQVLTL